MKHIHFFFRNQPVELTTDDKSKIASLMSLSRVVHNHFVTKYQNTHFSELDELDFSVESLELYLSELSHTEHFEMLAYQSSVTLHGIATLMSYVWTDAVAKRKHPKFQKHRDEGYFVYPCQEDFNIDGDTLKIFGFNDIELPKASIKLAGTPTLVLFRRQKNEAYWVTILYERVRSFSQDYVPTEVQKSGEKIHALLQDMRSTPTHLRCGSTTNQNQANWSNEGDVGMIRLMVLKTITHTRSLIKPLDTEMYHDRECDRETPTERRC